MATTTTTTNNATLAQRAAGLLTKATAYGAAQKALEQALTAKRVYPPMAEDFGAQLGIDLPLKTKEFTRVVAHLLASSDKPIKGIISKKKGDILSVLSELVSALTDTPAITLPAWAIPKDRTAKKAEAEAEAKAEAEAGVVGALDRANAEAEVLASIAAEAAEATKAEAKADTALAQAVALIVASAAELTEAQREMILAALEASEPAML